MHNHHRSIACAMSSSDVPDLTQLNETQQAALQAYTNVTDQEPIAAIGLLQRCEWNVQIAVSRFFDGEPTSDPVAEARAAQSVPAITSRHTTNLQYESLLTASQGSPLSGRNTREDVVQRIDTSSSAIPAYRPPFLLSALFTPFSILYRLFSTILSPFSFLLPSFVSRTFRNLLTPSAHTSRRQLPPADTARRFIREFEETYSPNPPLPWVETGFNLSLDTCKKEAKFLLAVLLSPSHDDTHSWVRDTLMSAQFHQFLQTHERELLLWGGSVQDSEGYQVSTSLNCTKFPFAALICQTAEAGSTTGQMTVVMRAVGPLPANELVAKLGSAMTAQQAQLSANRAQRAERQAHRSLREEQDSAYERSLAQDRERARRKREEEEARELAERQAEEAVQLEEKREQQREQWRQWRSSRLPEEPTTSENTVRLSIRMANGERLVRKFQAASPLEELYAYVECYDMPAVEGTRSAQIQPPENYEHDYGFRLVSPMPRKVIDLAQGGSIVDRVGRGANLIVETLDDEDKDHEG